MPGKTIVSFGSLLRDDVYIEQKSKGHKYFMGSRGGGANWNAVINARLLGATVSVIGIGGADEAAGLAIRDFEDVGINVLFKRLESGKRTRTLHEILDFDSIEHGNPKHTFTVRCPVCSRETYRTGTARFTKKYVETSIDLLRPGARNLLIHLDGIDSTRLKIIEKIKQEGSWFSLDLGRSTGLNRMRQQGLLNKLKLVDFLFVNSKVITELLSNTGSLNEKDLVDKLNVLFLVVTKGREGASLYVKVDGKVQEFTKPAVKVLSIVDTSGAGDAFIGQFLADLSKWNGPLLITSSNNQCDVINIIFERALKWAAQKCQYTGARGHIPGIQWSWEITKSSLKETQDVDEIKVENLKRNSCVVCNSELTYKLQDNISTLVFQRNVLELPRKIVEAWKLRHASEWEHLTVLNGAGYVIGTGGSYVVAQYVALLLTYHRKEIALPIYPFDYIRTGIKTNWAIFISNSGSTPDILSSYKHSYELKTEDKIIITRSSQDFLKNTLDSTRPKLLLTNTNGEKGFLSVAGISIPCYIAYSVFNPTLWMDDGGYSSFLKMYSKSLEKLNSIFGSIGKMLPIELHGRNVLILGGGFAWPAVLNLESKMTESGIGNPIISETKNYSHGRFISSINKEGNTGIALIVIYGMPDDKPYRDFMIGKFPRNVPICELVSDSTGPQGGIELLLMTEHLMKLISEREGIDISKPSIPRKGLELYRYSDILSFKESYDKG